MTWAVTRLQEAIVDKLSSDSELVNLTNDGLPDSVGTLHHIGVLLNEPALKDRLPFLGVVVLNSEPLIFNGGRLNLERTDVGFLVFSRDECLGTQIADRVQSLLTGIGSGDCNRGFYSFSNDYIRNLSTEYTSRMRREFDKVLDVYEEIIEAVLVWSPIPCSNEIHYPYCDTCYGLYPEVTDCEHELSY